MKNVLSKIKYVSYFSCYEYYTIHVTLIFLLCFKILFPQVLILSTIVGLGACAPDLFSGPPHHPHHSPYAPAPYHPAPAPYHPAPHYAPDPYEKLAPRPYAYEFGVQV